MGFMNEIEAMNIVYNFMPEGAIIHALNLIHEPFIIHALNYIHESLKNGVFGKIAKIQDGQTVQHNWQPTLSKGCGSEIL